MAINNWFNSLDPEVKKAIVAGGFSAGGSFLENMMAGRQQDRQLQQNAAAQVLGGTNIGEMPNTYASLAMRGALMKGIKPGMHTGNIGQIAPPSEFAPYMGQLGGLDLSGLPAIADRYLSPEALEADKQRRLDMERMVLGQTLQPQQQQKKGGFWRKLGKIASIAAPIIAAPFTGGATLAVIGAGSGALGALSSGGGAKDALTGALLGSTAGLGGKKGASTSKSIGNALIRGGVSGPTMVQGRAQLPTRFR